MTERAIIAMFYRPASGVPRLHALTLVNDYICYDGQIIRSRTEYDVEWSRSYGYYIFHQSGCGGGERVTASGLYYASGPASVNEQSAQWCDSRDKPPWHGRRTRIIRKRNRTRRMARLPRHIDLDPGQDLLAWLEHNGVDQDAVYCSECVDWVRGDHLCEHTWWCDQIGWYSTPGDPCGHDREECQG